MIFAVIKDLSGLQQIHIMNCCHRNGVLLLWKRSCPWCYLNVLALSNTCFQVIYKLLSCFFVSEAMSNVMLFALNNMNVDKVTRFDILKYLAHLAAHRSQR